jgi:hypothetical protein
LHLQATTVQAFVSSNLGACQQLTLKPVYLCSAQDRGLPFDGTLIGSPASNWAMLPATTFLTGESYAALFGVPHQANTHYIQVPAQPLENAAAGMYTGCIPGSVPASYGEHLVSSTRSFTAGPYPSAYSNYGKSNLHTSTGSKGEGLTSFVKRSIGAIVR